MPAPAAARRSLRCHSRLTQPATRGRIVVPGQKERFVTTGATPTDKSQELDERTLRAWKTYCDSIQSLTGEVYEHAEHESWLVLQEELRRVERSRPQLTPLDG